MQARLIRTGRFGGYVVYNPYMRLPDNALEKIRMFMVTTGVTEGAENQTMIIDFTYKEGEYAEFTRVGIIMDGGDWEDLPGFVLVRMTSSGTLSIHVPDGETRKRFAAAQSDMRLNFYDRDVNVFSDYVDSIVEDESKWQRWEDSAGAMDTEEFIA